MKKRKLLSILLALALIICAVVIIAPLLRGEEGSVPPEGPGLVVEPLDGPDEPEPAPPSDELDEPALPSDEIGEPLPETPDEPSYEEPSKPEEPPEPDEEELLPEDGSYTSKEDVALYIFQYGRLPGNFITKKEAEKLGWSGGSLEKYAPGKCIGGSRFGNYEGLLPDKKGRTWTECDINTLGASSRGAERIVFSNDGLIYYTGDHYASFELLYGEDGT